MILKAGEHSFLKPPLGVLQDDGSSGQLDVSKPLLLLVDDSCCGGCGDMLQVVIIQLQ